MISDFEIGRSLITQMSSGSPSPRSDEGESIRNFSPHNVRGINPYNAGGCDDVRFTADLATDAPADPDIIGVEANVLGLDFRRDDGRNTTLEFRNGELIDLLDLQDRDPLRLFTDEELPVGRYTGVRLLFDDDQDENLYRQRKFSDQQRERARRRWQPEVVR